ncbi:MAG: hypothetical protein J6U54_11435 [Clostridiales bacterium]|nr:hypothetical protein [Clostridiales bacterium]
MAEEVVDFKKLQKEAKKRERKLKREAKRKAFIDWCSNNKELAVILIPAGIGVGTALVKGGIHITKGIIRSHNLKKEEVLKDMYCYDRSLGHYWELRRKLTNDEWISIENRRKQGERLADILEDLQVLK